MALLRGGEVAWSGGFGAADAWEGIAVDARTRFALASVARLATAAATLLAAERGLVDLDEPVHVGFEMGDGSISWRRGAPRTRRRLR